MKLLQPFVLFINCFLLVLSATTYINKDRKPQAQVFSSNDNPSGLAVAGYQPNLSDFTQPCLGCSALKP